MNGRYNVFHRLETEQRALESLKIQRAKGQTDAEIIENAVGKCYTEKPTIEIAILLGLMVYEAQHKLRLATMK